MAVAVNMPQVGQDLDTARINEWYVSTGDEVVEGDILATVESDKASFDVEANSDGYILQLLFEPGDEATVFKPIAYIGEKNEKLQVEVSGMQQNIKKELDTPSVKISHHQFQNNPDRIFISPSARRIARENNLQINKPEDFKANQRIKKQDVLRALVKQKSSINITPLARKIAEEAEVNTQLVKGSGVHNKVLKRDLIPFTRIAKSKLLEVGIEDKVFVFDRIRKRIAERLTYSKHTIPHYYLFADINVTKTLQKKKELYIQSGEKVSVNDIIIYAASKALLKHAELNSHVDEEKMLIKRDINIGVAVATEMGLMVPVIHKADKLSLKEIHDASLKISVDAKRGVVQVKYPGTFTISNLGMLGISKFLPIINPPECAILSIGTIEKKVIPQKEKIVIADFLTIGIACDHRAVDGAKAAIFLNDLKSYIENFENES